jgi:hypothetical protein
MGKQCARIPHGVLLTGVIKSPERFARSPTTMTWPLKSELFMKKSSTGTVLFRSNA